jgi:hypothetical protein
LFVLKPGGGRLECAVQLEEVATELAIRQGRFGERDVGGEARRLLLAGRVARSAAATIMRQDG